ncbi:tetratricopeptide repeat protein [Plantactinospora sp. S1510]|uniref:Tetratricopeptide repeat protein n=1 Tax=Plantactinospora alkalitolerans TaxID=2789879 RepID=A0ABS0GYV6_9ACTN|nr:tetratricopeptide repeat protein [Plantactinospora alkalitolerans]MBF9131406.1 tetratricopeptide repeat protein [Plantactinospora alkalitolerans]
MAVQAQTALTAAGHGMAIGSVGALYMGGDGERPVVSVAPPMGRRSRHLRGRDDLVGELLGLVSDGVGGSRVRVLHGLGGRGKTSIALEVCARSAGGPVWWVSAVDEVSLRAGLTAVARHAGASEQELRAGDLGDVLWGRLAGLASGWLLVVDNADDPQVLAGSGQLADGNGWLRPAEVAGLVVVTSRSARWPSWCHPQRVGMLDEELAAEVLRDAAGEQAGGLDEARALARWLGGLPLALRLAGAYLAATGAALLPEPGRPATFVEYLEVLQADGGRRFVAGQEMAEEVTSRALTLSLDLLARRGLEQAEVLLRLLAQFAEAPIPFRLLLDPEVLSQSGVLGGVSAGDISRLLEALADMALIDVTAGTGVQRVLTLHPVVRTASLDTFAASHGDPSDLETVAALAIYSAADGESTGLPEDPPRWPLWQLLAPHAFELLRRVSRIEGPSSDLVGWAAYSAGLAARAARAQGDYEQARTEFQAIYDIGRRTLGDEHPYTLTTRHELAGVLHDQGDYEQARTEFQAIYDIERRTLGDEHPHTLATRHNLAGVLHDQGDYEQARTEFQAIYDIWRRTLGDEHPDTLQLRDLLDAQDNPVA